MRSSSMRPSHCNEPRQFPTWTPQVSEILDKSGTALTLELLATSSPSTYSSRGCLPGCGDLFMTPTIRCQFPSHTSKCVRVADAEFASFRTHKLMLLLAPVRRSAKRS